MRRIRLERKVEGGDGGGGDGEDGGADVGEERCWRWSRRVERQDERGKKREWGAVENKRRETGALTVGGRRRAALGARQEGGSK